MEFIKFLQVVALIFALIIIDGFMVPNFVSSKSDFLVVLGIVILFISNYFIGKYLISMFKQLIK